MWFTAITLQHLFSEEQSTTYCHGCDKCNFFFTSADHLQFHHTYSSCGKNDHDKEVSKVVEMEEHHAEELQPDLVLLSQRELDSDAAAVTEEPSSGETLVSSEIVLNKTPYKQQSTTKEIVTEMPSSASRHKRTKVIIPEGMHTIQCSDDSFFLSYNIIYSFQKGKHSLLLCLL
jgi:hypothetical protein